MQNDDNIVKLVNVHKSYGSNEVLKGIDLTIKQGDFVSIRGKSGVGKTNLFKIIGLLEMPDKGTLSVFGKDALVLKDDQKAELRLKKIGLIFQFFNLLPSLTVFENIELPMALRGVRKQQRKERADELLKFFEISKLADRFPENLSGGEKQRVAIIRALANCPAILLADEPTSSLDDENSALLLDLLSKIRKEEKLTMLVTSTDLYEKLPTSRDYMLKEGRIKKIN